MIGTILALTLLVGAPASPPFPPSGAVETARGVIQCSPVAFVAVQGFETPDGKQYRLYSAFDPVTEQATTPLLHLYGDGSDDAARVTLLVPKRQTMTLGKLRTMVPTPCDLLGLIPQRT